jgi:hypothetical protein
MLLARLVTGRYGNRTTDEEIGSSTANSRPGWVHRLVAAVFGRKSPA